MGSSILDGPGFSSGGVCGWGTLPGSTLCVGCLDIREWSRVNRAFCDLLHRTQAFDRATHHARIYEAAGFALTA